MSIDNAPPKVTLDEIGLRFGTDKASDRHNFLRHYEFFLGHLVDQQFTLLELGVGPIQNMGKSLHMWREFFPLASIVGVDDKPIAKSVEGDRISVEIGDLGQLEFLRYIADKYKPLVIVDDASHIWSHQILALETLYTSLQSGGYYIVEDLHTSFGDLAQRYGQKQYQDTMTYLGTLSALVGGDRALHGSYSTMRPSPMQVAIAERMDMVAFCRHTAVLSKKADRSKGLAAKKSTENKGRASAPASGRQAVDGARKQASAPKREALDEFDIGLNPFTSKT